ncbi:hypothetical protein D3C85_1159600 [compost metagenome]
MAIAGNQDRAVTTGEALCLLHLLAGELGLSGPQLGGRHGLLLVLDAPGIEEVDHRAAVLGLDLRHLGSRDGQGAGLRRELGPLAVDLPSGDAGCRRRQLPDGESLALLLDAEPLGRRQALAGQLGGAALLESSAQSALLAGRQFALDDFALPGKAWALILRLQLAAQHLAGQRVTYRRHAACAVLLGGGHRVSQQLALQRLRRHLVDARETVVGIAAAVVRRVHPRITGATDGGVAAGVEVAALVSDCRALLLLDCRLLQGQQLAAQPRTLGCQHWRHATQACTALDVGDGLADARFLRTGRRRLLLLRLLPAQLPALAKLLVDARSV